MNADGGRGMKDVRSCCRVISPSAIALIGFMWMKMMKTTTAYS